MSKLVKQLRKLAAASPDAVAVTDKQRSLTRAQLIAEVTTMARRLEVYRGQVLALLLENQIDWLVIDLACLQAGVILLPLPVFFSSEQQQHAIEQSAAIALICSVAPNENRQQTSELIIQPIVQSMSAKIPENTVKITFTSGSTGQPRGVCLSEANQFNVAHALLQRSELVKPRHLCVLPLATLLENIAGVYAPLLSGGEVILLPISELGFNGGSEFDVQKLALVLEKVQPDSLILLPGLLSGLIEHIRHGWRIPASLKFVAVGGSHVGSGLLQAAEAVNFPIYEGYGLSECSSVVSLNSAKQKLIGSAGKPLSHIQVTIKDDEIMVAGNSFLGYVNEPESWYADRVSTGDLGYVDNNGFLHIMGRRKNLLINSYGRNINPEWIESEILANPAIAQCIVSGDACPYCVALIFSRQSVSDAYIDDWIHSVNQALPDYARIRHWFRLPKPLSQSSGTLTANGKPVRKQIDRLYQSNINSFFKEKA